MKNIIFLRHSKSSWDYNVSDINRPLNEIGISKIKKISSSSKEEFSSVEIFFSSPANRAIHTAIILARELSHDLNKIQIVENLYTFSSKEVFEFIKIIDDKYSNVAIVGHNPAYTEIANYFSDKRIDNLPTSRWFSVKFDTNYWADIIDLKPLTYIDNINIEY